MISLEQTDPTYALVAGLIGDCYRPRVKENVWQWSEANVYLDEKASPGHPGPYDSALTPYARTIQEFYTDPEWDELVVKKSSQVGITEGVLNCVRFAVANQPTNILYAIDSREEAKKIAKTRLQPSLKRIAATAAVIGENEDDFTNLTMYLPSMTIYLTGGHSAGALANKPIGTAVVDEADEHPPPKSGETENVDKIRERLKTVPNKKLFIIGRPKTDKHVTAREYATGTQEKYYVPCPHCAHRQELIFERVKFDHCKDLLGEWDLQRAGTETYYQCESVDCHEPIRDAHKHYMLLHGEWRVTNPRHKPRKRSIHISDLYSPFVTFAELAMEFIEASKSGSLTKLQNFRNARLGLEWKQQQAEVTESDVLALRGAYRRGTCPFPPVVIGMTSDKQGDVLKWVKGAFKSTGECAVIDYGFALVEDELVDICKAPVEILGSDERMSGRIGLVDEGFKATDVRDFCLRSEGIFWPCKGRGGIQVRHTVAESKTLHEGDEIIVYHFDDDDFKKQLYISCIGKLADIKKGLSRTPRLWLPSDIDRDFVNELSAEKLVEQKTAWGFSKFVWEKTGDNDFGDAVKMLLVLWHIIAPFFKET